MTQAREATNAHRCAVVLLTLCVVSCSKSVEVPADTYGLALKLGNVVSVTKGPATATYIVFLGEMKLIPQHQLATFPVLAGDVSISVQINDPVLFFRLTGGKVDVLTGYYGDKTRSLPPASAEALLLSELNMPGTGLEATLEMHRDEAPREDN